MARNRRSLRRPRVKYACDSPDAPVDASDSELPQTSRQVPGVCATRLQPVLGADLPCTCVQGSKNYHAQRHIPGVSAQVSAESNSKNTVVDVRTACRGERAFLEKMGEGGLICFDGHEPRCSRLHPRNQKNATMREIHCATQRWACATCFSGNPKALAINPPLQSESVVSHEQTVARPGTQSERHGLLARSRHQSLHAVSTTLRPTPP